MHDREDLIEQLAEDALNNVDNKQLEETYYNVMYGAFDELEDDELLNLCTERGLID